MVPPYRYSYLRLTVISVPYHSGRQYLHDGELARCVIVTQSRGEDSRPCEIHLMTSASELRDLLASQQATSDLSFHWERPNALRRNLAAFEQLRESCDWHKDPKPPRFDLEASGTEYDAHIYKYAPFPVCDQWCPWPGGRSVPSLICELRPSSADDGHGWLVQRIGPVVTHGGNSFAILREDDALGLADLLGDRGGEMWITAISLAAIDDNGHILGYPPIHIHHSHVGPHDTIGILDFVSPLHFPHGETSCLEEDGGTACYMFTFPDGVGFRLTEPLVLNAMLNDVRPAGLASLSFSVELAIRYTMEPVRHNLGLWYVATDSDANAFSMLLRGQQVRKHHPRSRCHCSFATQRPHLLAALHPCAARCALTLADLLHVPHPSTCRIGRVDDFPLLALRYTAQPVASHTR